jgi:hypothetical protein
VEKARHAAAWHRAAIAKRTLAAVAALTFVGGVGLVRAHVASHHKRKLRPLAAPKRFTDVVRRDLLAAGIMAPAEAPADVATAVS